MSREKAILRLRADLLRQGLSMENVARALGLKGVTLRAAVGRYWGKPKEEWPQKGKFRRALDHLAEITGKKGAKGMVDVTAEQMRKEGK